MQGLYGPSQALEGELGYRDISTGISAAAVLVHGIAFDLRSSRVHCGIVVIAVRSFPCPVTVVVVPADTRVAHYDTGNHRVSTRVE